MTSVLILVISSIFPPLIFLLPAPSIVVYVRSGLKYGLASIGIVFAALSLLNGLSFAILMLLFFLPMVLLMGKMIEEEYSFKSIIFTNFIALTIIVLIYYINYKYFFNKDLVNYILEYFKDLEKILPELIDKVNFPGYSNEELLEIYKFTLNNVKMNLPAIFIIVGLLSELLSLNYALKMLKSQGMNIKQKFRFINFRIGIKFIIPITISVIVVFLMYYFKIPYYNIVLSNIVLLLTVFFTIAGVSLADYYFVGKLNRFLRLLLPFILITSFKGYILYIFIGIIDMFVNFRKRYRRLENEKK